MEALNTAVALMMIFCYNTGNLHNAVKGEFYEPTSAVYSTTTDETYVIWERYSVYGEKYGQYGSYNTNLLHLQVRPVKGHVTLGQVRADGRARSDSYISYIDTFGSSSDDTVFLK